MTLAKAFVSGVVVKAPEKRFTQNDMAIASFTLNIDNANETLVRVVAYGNTADTIEATVSQNDMVAVEGKLQTNTSKLPNGKDKKVFEIVASAVEKMSVSNAMSNPISSNQNIVSFDNSISNDDMAQDLVDESEIPF